MVDTTVSGMTGGLAAFGDKALVFMLIIMVLAVAGVCGWFIWSRFRKWKRYRQYNCLLFYRDSGGAIHSRTDWAGVFVDKGINSKRLWLKDLNTTLKCDKVQSYDFFGMKLVLLFMKSDKCINFINPTSMSDGMGFKLSEDDLSWALEEMQKQRKRWAWNPLKEWMPYIIMVFITIMIVVVLSALIKKFDVLKDVAIALDHAATIMSSCNNPTQVITP